MQFRFGLRTLLIVVTLVCFGFWAIPAALEWSKWQLLRAVVTDTMDQIAASPDKPAVYAGMAWHSRYVLANVELTWDPVTDSGSQPLSAPRNDAVFVEMPGKVHKWAQSPAEVMELLREND